MQAAVSAEFVVYYQCHRCKYNHPGDSRTPDMCRMVASGKPNEWVFECVAACGKQSELDNLIANIKQR